jgi:hypothetical protein
VRAHHSLSVQAKTKPITGSIEHDATLAFLISIAIVGALLLGLERTGSHDFSIAASLFLLSHAALPQLEHRFFTRSITAGLGLAFKLAVAIAARTLDPPQVYTGSVVRRC